MVQKIKRNYLFWSTGTFSLAGYIYISYFTARYQSYLLLGLYFVLFAAYLILLKTANNPYRIRLAYGMGFVFRLSLLFLVPNLSDDIYRFLWDGHLVASGFNPYVNTPLQILENPEISIPGITTDLFRNFGKDTFSSYPPLNQWIFALAVWISPESIFGSILFIRFFILIFEAGNIWLIQRIIKREKLPATAALIYVLNPLIILELSGNLHFEAFMIFFLLLSFYYLKDRKLIKGAISVGLAILSKLIPLIYFPLILKKFGFRNGMKVVLISSLLVVLAFLPFINQDMIVGITDSLALYFRKFEFNASIYYLIREAGYWLFGYNIIQSAGPILGIITFLLILWYSFSSYAGQVSLMESGMWILTIYLAMTTTLHPWYITTLIALSVFTSFRYPVAWSFFIFLSYSGYLKEDFRENYWLVFLEYAVVYSWMIIEIIKQKKSLKGDPAGS